MGEEDKKGGWFSTWTGHFDNKGVFDAVKFRSFPSGGADLQAGTNYGLPKDSRSENDYGLPKDTHAMAAGGSENGAKKEGAAEGTATNKDKVAPQLCRPFAGNALSSTVSEKSDTPRREDKKTRDQKHELCVSFDRGEVVDLKGCRVLNASLGIIVSPNGATRCIIVPCEQRNSSLSSPAVVQLGRSDGFPANFCARCDWLTNVASAELKPSAVGKLPAETMKKVDRALAHAVGLHTANG
jgi:hypothetical protein